MFFVKFVFLFLRKVGHKLDLSVLGFFGNKIALRNFAF